MMANEKPAQGLGPLAGLSHNLKNYSGAIKPPNEFAVNFRKALPEAERKAATRGYTEVLNWAEALVNAASCRTCAFFDSGDCRARSPRLLVVNGERQSAWPPMHPDGYCGDWREA